jgi:hypothetical protein
MYGWGLADKFIYCADKWLMSERVPGETPKTITTHPVTQVVSMTPKLDPFSELQQLFSTVIMFHKIRF